MSMDIENRFANSGIPINILGLSMVDFVYVLLVLLKLDETNIIILSST